MGPLPRGSFERSMELSTDKNTRVFIHQFPSLLGWGLLLGYFSSVFAMSCLRMLGPSINVWSKRHRCLFPCVRAVCQSCTWPLRRAPTHLSQFVKLRKPWESAWGRNNWVVLKFSSSKRYYNNTPVCPYTCVYPQDIHRSRITGQKGMHLSFWWRQLKLASYETACLLHPYQYPC